MILRRGTVQVVHESDVPRPRQEVEQEEKNPDDNENNNDDDDSSDDDPVEEEEDQPDPIRLVTCPVVLRPLDEDSSYHDLVQSFGFEEFDGLWEFMMTPPTRRDLILKRHPETLRLVHERLKGVVQDIVDKKRDMNLGTTSTPLVGTSDAIVATFATPNVRLRPGGYATFLHADAIFPKQQVPGSATTTSSSTSAAASAMINIWIPLGKEPISNFPLCFYKCHRNETIFAENKLYFCWDDNKDTNNTNNNNHRDPLELKFVPGLQWGTFLCFAAGQSISEETVLLHGAVNMDESPFYDRSSESRINNKKKEPPRQSIELRYLL